MRSASSAAVLFQRVMKCVNEPSDVEAYRANRELLTKGLSELGYEFVEPDGAFYLWVRALEPDDEAFCEKAKSSPTSARACHVLQVSRLGAHQLLRVRRRHQALHACFQSAYGGI